ncbi:hypothetical protein ACFL27_06520 [candidate division CSSED10-310 bacterium]|uniref:DUF5050 domain-containing protein n=1 Tax=candidate division CSSED10-310 bacterium TaxID=2855610 RepID=A0ABV6YUG3_UNCC1
MKKIRILNLLAAVSILLALSFILIVCNGDDDDDNDDTNSGRSDAATQVNINESGSLQNGAWSPDSDALVFTRFRNGYNMEPADLFIIDLASNSVRTLVSDGSGNVNLPGSCWHSSSESIIFSSSREPHDEIYLIDDGGSTGDEDQITDRADYVAYEPSFSPDGLWVVFESHPVDVEDQGVITKFRIDGSGSYIALTEANDDCRQPNWAPAGNLICYQKLSDGSWNIWVMNTDGSNKKKVTSGAGDKTDASFSPDGQWIVYSSDENELAYANLFIISVSGGTSLRITDYDGYDGAPSWSPDGKKIVFESYPGDPDDSSGTTIWMIDVPNL